MKALAVVAAVLIAQAVLVSCGDNSNDDEENDYVDNCPYMWMMMNNSGFPVVNLAPLVLVCLSIASLAVSTNKLI